MKKIIVTKGTKTCTIIAQKTYPENFPDKAVVHFHVVENNGFHLPDRPYKADGMTRVYNLKDKNGYLLILDILSFLSIEGHYRVKVP